MSLVRQEQTNISGSMGGDPGTSGLLVSTSGYFENLIFTTSGYLYTLLGAGYDIAPYSGYVENTFAKKIDLVNASGTLNTKIDNVSGTLTTYVNTQINTYSGFVSNTYPTEVEMDTLSGYLVASLSGTIVGSMFDKSDYKIARLTGLGSNFSGWYDLSTANLGVDHPVNGVTGVPVFPAESGAILVNSYLTVNGFQYHLDYWQEHVSGVAQPGYEGNTTASGGYALNFNCTYGHVQLKWNYTGYAGFELLDTDNITLHYWI